MYAFLYRQDLVRARLLADNYNVGVRVPPVLPHSPQPYGSLPGFQLISVDHPSHPPTSIPFVYEPQNAPYLQALRNQFHLESYLTNNNATEYDAMLRLGAWLGTRWDHGDDPLVGTDKVCDPSDAIEAGQHGAKYWCEIAARTTVHAFTSLGWIGRVITASRDGYTWEHAVAEIWSDQFNKWFVLDTDFNVVFEADGIPLSAWDLLRDGERLERSGKLHVRHFAPPKPSLPYTDLLPFFSYIHVDLRNDWCTRHLAPGSPAGGDLSTWWNARRSLHPILTAMARIEDEGTFDWKVNTTSLLPLKIDRLASGKAVLQIGLSGYSPVFEYFEINVDHTTWERTAGDNVALTLAPGTHTVAAHMITASGYAGPSTSINFVLSSGSD